MTEKGTTPKKKRIGMPSAEKIQEELAKAENMDDFFGRDGIFARLFSKTMEQMLEAELSDHLSSEFTAFSTIDRAKLSPQ